MAPKIRGRPMFTLQVPLTLEFSWLSQAADPLDALRKRVFCMNALNNINELLCGAPLIVPPEPPVAAGKHRVRRPLPPDAYSSGGSWSSSPGQPSPGQPSPGQSSPGQPSPGQPSLGQPSLGQPSLGQPSLGQPSSHSSGVSSPVTLSASTVDALRASIDRFVSIADNSAVKSAAVERVVAAVLREAFPDAAVEDTSSTPNEGDARITFRNGVSIMVEIKSHAESAVRHTDVEKFERDVQSSAVDAGVFVATRSAIARKKRMEVETVFPSNKFVTYVPHVDANYDRLTWAVLCLAELVVMKRKYEATTAGGAAAATSASLLSALTPLEEVGHAASRARQSAAAKKNVMDRLSTEMVTEATQMETGVARTIAALRHIIRMAGMGR